MEHGRADRDDATRGEQAALWNTTGGNAWVELQETLDGMFEPFERLLASAAANAPGPRALDVGCGTGATTLAVARRLGERGRVTGLDISEPMIAAARARAEREGVPATFVVADAQRHGFSPASFDLIVSRFGVMFFDDPVAAFANLRRAAADRARMRLVAWRSPGDNPFMTEAERAAAPLLPPAPPPEPGSPGQFAFADPEHVRGLLERSGWSGIELEPVDATCTLPESALMPYLTRLGSVGRRFHQLDRDLQQRLAERMRAAFEPYVHGDEVRFRAACWSIGARAG